jgi:hypothetical protein
MATIFLDLGPICWREQGDTPATAPGRTAATDGGCYGAKLEVEKNTSCLV